MTVSQSLELIAETFGVANWNTLAAAIHSAAFDRRKSVLPLPPPGDEGGPTVRFSPELQATLHRAFGFARRRMHEYTTLEHLLLALIEDADASGAMKACNVDLATLNDAVAGDLDIELKELVTADGEATGPTAAFQRVVQRAVVHVRASGGQTVTGVQLVLAIFAERESPAVHFLIEQALTRQDVAHVLAHGIGKGGV
ncbi:Clp protease N-terminal domain-containing protein [Bradyrhizobium sp.]|uniref:Clp protease N-terminal domain-containing protein n=1 Tax=Bradyrhizobium sp. TaxID=376 RepID=UPI003C3E0769